jgi:hypothetical protein
MAASLLCPEPAISEEEIVAVEGGDKVIKILPISMQYKSPPHSFSG